MAVSCYGTISRKKFHNGNYGVYGTTSTRWHAVRGSKTHGLPSLKENGEFDLQNSLQVVATLRLEKFRTWELQVASKLHHKNRGTVFLGRLAGQQITRASIGACEKVLDMSGSLRIGIGVRLRCGSHRCGEVLALFLGQSRPRGIDGRLQRVRFWCSASAARRASVGFTASRFHSDRLRTLAIWHRRVRPLKIRVFCRLRSAWVGSGRALLTCFT
jgi:hypothetical protein